MVSVLGVMAILSINSDRLGVKSRVFHLGDYRRATMGPGTDIPEDYFFVEASPESVLLRQKILKKCREDIYSFLNHENGQVAIYDAVNPLIAGRKSLAKEFAKHDVQVKMLLYSPELYLNPLTNYRPCSLNHMSRTRRFCRKMLAVSKLARPT